MPDFVSVFLSQSVSRRTPLRTSIRRGSLTPPRNAAILQQIVTATQAATDRNSSTWWDGRAGVDRATDQATDIRYVRLSCLDLPFCEEWSKTSRADRVSFLRVKCSDHDFQHAMERCGCPRLHLANSKLLRITSAIRLWFSQSLGGHFLLILMKSC